MEPDESIRAFEKASHAAAQGLCMEKHGDARYDPGKPKHRKWLRRGQAAVAFAEPFLRANERRKVIAELTSAAFANELGSRLTRDAVRAYDTMLDRALDGEQLASRACAMAASLLAPAEEGVMPKMRTDEPEPQARHIEEASA